jgi:hypothetical protein
MMMDTTKLVVGQNVSLVGAAWSLRGKVVRFTPEGVEVYVKKLGTYLFDNEGRGSDEGCPLVLKAVIDMKTLVVGQNVSMSSGCYRQFGKVAKVTPEGVEVQVHPGGGIARFDNEGEGRPGNSTFECGLWYIDTEPLS